MGFQRRKINPNSLIATKKGNGVSSRLFLTHKAEEWMADLLSWAATIELGSVLSWKKQWIEWGDLARIWFWLVGVLFSPRCQTLPFEIMEEKSVAESETQYEKKKKKLGRMNPMNWVGKMWFLKEVPDSFCWIPLERK